MYNIYLLQESNVVMTSKVGNGLINLSLWTVTTVPLISYRGSN